MPDFYEKMKDRLRTAEQGADTATWLAVSEAALKQPSGLFFEGTSSLSINSRMFLIAVCFLKIAVQYPSTFLWPGLTRLKKKKLNL